MVTDFRALLEALTDGQVDFVLVGGVALVVQGAPRTTEDLDICYARDDQNIARLAAALAPFSPRLRGAPADLPFRLDARTIRSGLNFTLTSLRGDVDLLGEITGIGGYAAVASASEIVTLYGRAIRVMTLDGLERAKRAAGRLKDLADLAHIAELRKRRGFGSRDPG